MARWQDVRMSRYSASLRFAAVPEGELCVGHIEVSDGVSDLEDVGEGEDVAEIAGMHLRGAGRAERGEEGRSGGGVGLAPRPVLHLIS